MPWKDVEVLGYCYDIVPYHSPFTLDTLKIYVAKTCPKLSQTVGIFQVQRTDPARVERNKTQVWHLKD